MIFIFISLSFALGFVQSCVFFHALFASALRQDILTLAGPLLQANTVSRLVGSNSLIKPVLEDIADTDLFYEKVQKVNMM